MISQPPVVVVDAEVGGAHLTHPELLLLVGAGRHGVPVLLLRLHLLLPQVLHLLHELDALLHVPLGPELLGRRQLLANVLRELVDIVGLVGDLAAQRLLGLGQVLLALLDLLVDVIDKLQEVITGVNIVEMIFLLLSRLVICSQGQIMHSGALSHVHPLKTIRVITNAISSNLVFTVAERMS